MLKKITQKFIPESKGCTGETANSHLEVSWIFADTLEHAKIYNPSELNPETLSTHFVIKATRRLKIWYTLEVCDEKPGKTCSLEGIFGCIK